MKKGRTTRESKENLRRKGKLLSEVLDMPEVFITNFALMKETKISGADLRRMAAETCERRVSPFPVDDK